MRILLLEDDHNYQASIKEYLQILAYKVDAYDDGDSALEAVFENSYDLLLMDIRVPGANGYDIAKIVRENSIDIPIIFITSLVEIEYLSQGYELGCDDYIRKPFALKELKYRIEQSINAHSYKSSLRSINLPQNFVYCTNSHELTKDGVYIPLTKTELNIVDFLVQRKGVFSSISQIIECLWKDEYISEADVRMHIRRIRKKTHPELIVNSKGLGYKIENI